MLFNEFALIAFAIMVFGIPFIRFNYVTWLAKKPNASYESIKKHLPNLTLLESQLAYKERYGV